MLKRISPLLFVALLQMAIPSWGATVEGVVVGTAGPLVQAEVRAYLRLDDVWKEKPAYTSRPGDKKGFYRLELPAGTYYIVASGTDAGRSYFSFPGANPVGVREETIWLPLAAMPVVADNEAPAGKPTVTGRVTYKGEGVSGAQVSLYTASSAQFKGMGLATRTTSADGAFSFSPPEGDYLVVARKRGDAAKKMALSKGDLFCFHLSGPVTVAAGKEKRIDLPCYPRDDLKAFLEPGREVKKAREGQARFREKKKGGEATHAITGVVSDRQGRPLPGLTVTAYRTESGEIFQMHQVRDRGGARGVSDAEGRYRIELKEPGDYVLVARQLDGESPRPGELYGIFEGNIRHAVAVDGEEARADITAGPVMKPGDQAPPQAAAVPKKGARTVLRDVVLTADTLWTGEVTIDGVVVVARGATLTIAPGTVIRFVRRDLNNDGVGDGEIRVLGRLLAQGTERAPIRFTSAEKKPAAADWSYILLFTADGKGVIDHAILEYAYTGFQIHFATGEIRNSLVRRNVEGLRFGRAEAVVRGNTIRNNRWGVRYHRLEGPLVIRNNDIVANEVGMALLPSGQKTIDFAPERYQAAPGMMRMPEISGNNIVRNTKYGYLLGDRERYDVDLAGNWWGTRNGKTIAAYIFDGEEDPELGRVRVEPILRAPVRLKQNPIAAATSATR